MSAEDNKAIYRRAVDTLINQRNLDAMADFCTADYVWHGPGGKEAKGIEGGKQNIGMYLGAFPDLHMTVDDLVAEGDQVVARWTGTGTHGGDLAGIAPTGKSVTVHGIIICRFEGGKIAEEWEQMEELSMMQQMGVIPAEEKATA